MRKPVFVGSSLAVALLVALVVVYTQRSGRDPARGAPPASEASNPSLEAPKREGTTSTTTSASPQKPAITGQGAPATILRTSQTSVVLRLRVAGAPPEGNAPQHGSPPDSDDFSAGPLESSANLKLRIVPAVELIGPVTGLADTFDVRLSGLVPFGEYSVPIFFRDRQVETVRFNKPGLVVRPDTAPTVAYQKDGYMTLVLENPSAEALVGVKARVRFEGVDECQVTADQNSDPPQPHKRDWWPIDLLRWLNGWLQWVVEPFRPRPSPPCDSETQWKAFAVRPSSQVSLRLPVHDAWFEDRSSRLTRSATRTGLLTLRYQSATSGGTEGQPAGTEVFEQNIPVEGRFEARTGRLFLTIARVFALLLTGAIVFLVLRVSIPNYRRKKALKDKLNDARIAISNLSDQVQSQLRVLVNVDRLVLDERRRQGWVLLPGFEDLARHIDTSLATLNRKVALVEKLDAVSGRRENLLAQPVAPTRIDAIERNLDAACEALKTDQLSEADFLVIAERLASADKETQDPTPEETQAFQMQLSQRWQAIATHFRRDSGSGALEVPASLAWMAKAFPDPALLPKNDDATGERWISAVGIVRADLQLTALELIREAHFQAPALEDSRWSEVRERLAEWLATPAIANLGPARALLAQVAEGTSEKNIVDAIEGGEAFIDLDPQSVGPNQSVRLTVRFRDPRLNAMTARAAVQCDWHFDPPTRSGRRRRKQRPAEEAGQPAPQGELTPQVERGWRVHRYFEPDVVRQRIQVAFYRRGQPLAVKQPEQFVRVVVPEEPVHSRRDKTEFWRRAGFQTLQMLAALLVPLVTLAITTAGEPSSSQWWDLVGLGFGSEAIRNILSTDQPSPGS